MEFHARLRVFVNWMRYISLFLGVYIYIQSLISTIGSIFFGMLEFQICQRKMMKYIIYIDVVLISMDMWRFILKKSAFNHIFVADRI